jgi:hypothetical protein
MLSGYIDAALKIKFLFFSKKWAKRIVSFDSGLKIGPLNLIGGGSYDESTKKHQQPVARDVKTWKSSYGSAPFQGLQRLSMPPGLTANASFDTARAGELFYDSLCTCQDLSESCNRQADCCDANALCNQDPILVNCVDIPCTPTGQIDTCPQPPAQKCDQVIPPTKICRAKPDDDNGPGPVK